MIRYSVLCGLLLILSPLVVPDATAATSLPKDLQELGFVTGTYQLTRGDALQCSAGPLELRKNDGYASLMIGEGLSVPLAIPNEPADEADAPDPCTTQYQLEKPKKGQVFARTITRCPAEGSSPAKEMTGTQSLTQVNPTTLLYRQEPLAPKANPVAAFECHYRLVKSVGKTKR